MIHSPTRLIPAALGLAALATLASTPAHAATLYWDANGAAAGLGGDGTWQNTGGNWSTDLGGEAPTTWANANLDLADFRGDAGAVTVNGGVSASQLLFNEGGYTLQGDAITLTPPNLASNFGISNSTVALNYAAGTATTTVSNDLIIQHDASVTGTAVYLFRNATAGELVLNGGISIDYTTGVPSGSKSYHIQAADADGVVTLNGSFAAAPAGATSTLMYGNPTGANGTFIANTDNTDAMTVGGRINGGTLLIGHNNALGASNKVFTLGTSGTQVEMRLLTNGAHTVANNLSMSGGTSSQSVLGGNTAHVSTFSGTFNANGFTLTPDPIFTAAAGGRVNFTGNIINTAANLRGARIEADPDGIIAFSANSNTLKGTVQVNSGTLLILNTAGSGTGTGGVTVAGGAAFGGTGIETGLVTASTATSRFTPGDIDTNGDSEIGTLRLHGGLAAASGATFAFDIDGTAIDMIDFGSADLDLGGTVTFDFTALGEVLTGNPYSLFNGDGGWTGSPTFALNAPAGYVLDAAYGDGGYLWDADGNSLTVQFAVPEPASLALLGLGGLMLLPTRKRMQ